MCMEGPGFGEVPWMEQALPYILCISGSTVSWGPIGDARFPLPTVDTWEPKQLEINSCPHTSNPPCESPSLQRSVIMETLFLLQLFEFPSHPILNPEP